MKPHAYHGMRITLAVWKALLMREAVGRLSLKRGAWFWIVLAPAEHIAYLMLLHSLIGQRMIPGVNLALFIAVGVLPFVLTRNVTLRGMEALDANRALMIYRQLKPFDAVFVRALLEGLLLSLVTVVLLVACWLFGLPIGIADPINVLLGLLLMWTLGLGFALILTATSPLVPELGQIARMAFGPLFILSATLFPSTWIPAPWQPILFLNPLLHGIEMLRMGVFPDYRVPEAISPFYLTLWAISALALGLALQVRYMSRMVER